MKRNARLRCPFRKGTCEITQKTRRQCQACRLRKCLESGMRKESEWRGVPGRAGAGARAPEPGAQQGGPRVCVCAGVHTGTTEVCARAQVPGQLVAWEPRAGTRSGACSPSAGTTALWGTGQMAGTPALCSGQVGVSGQSHALLSPQVPL